MKNVNKYKKKTIFNRILAILPFTLCAAGYSYADSVTDAIPEKACTFFIDDVIDWDRLRSDITTHSSFDCPVIAVKISGTLHFSDVSSMPKQSAFPTIDVQIDLQKRDLYIYGDPNSSKNVIEGVVLKGRESSLFTNLGNILYVDGVDIENSFILPQAGRKLPRNVGFFADTVKNAYFKNVNLKNVGMRGLLDSTNSLSTFNDVGFLVGVVERTAEVTHVSVDGLQIFDMYVSNMGSLFGRAKWSVSADDCQLSNIALTGSLMPGNSKDVISMSAFGGLVGSQDISAGLFTVNNTSIDADISLVGQGFEKFAYAAGVAGYVMANVADIERVSVSGNINVQNSSTSAMTKASTIRAAGIFAYWNSRNLNSRLNFEKIQSSVDFSVDLSNYEQTVITKPSSVSAVINQSAVGGLVGYVAFSDKNQINVIESEFSGSINYQSGDLGYPGLGGIIGVYKNTSADESPLTFSDVKVNGDGAIQYDGTGYASVGNLMGVAVNASIRASESVFEKDIHVTLSGDEGDIDGASVGGVIGTAIQAPVKFIDVSVKSDLFVDDNMKNADMSADRLDLSIGGAVGYAEESSLKLDVDYLGTISVTRDNSGSTKEKASKQYVGGLVGKIYGTNDAESAPEVVILNSSAVGKNGTLISTVFKGNKNYSSFMTGGLIGGSVLRTKSIRIEKTFVTGDITAQDMKHDGISYMSGMLGFILVNGNVDIMNSYYHGAMVTSVDPGWPDEVELSVNYYPVASFGMIDDLTLSNVYVCETNSMASSGSLYSAGAYTKVNLENALAFSNENYVTNKMAMNSPAFAYSLNENLEEPLWFYDMNSNGGLPQLSLAASDPKPTQKVTLAGFDVSGDEASDVVIYTNSDGKWELKGDGRRFNDNDLDVAIYDPTTKKLVFWKQQGGDLEWKGLSEMGSVLADGMVFEKQIVDVPKVSFGVDTTVESGNRIWFWDNSEYSMVDDEKLPDAVFEIVFNGVSTIYKGAYWTVPGKNVVFTSSAQLIDYVSHNLPEDGNLKLEFAFDAISALMFKKTNNASLTLEEENLWKSLESQRFETTVVFSNTSGVLARYTSAGHERIGAVTIKGGNSALLPKVDKFAIIDVLDGDSSSFSFVISKTGGEVLRSEYLYGEDLDLSTLLSDGDQLMIYRMGRIYHVPTGPDSVIVVDSTGKPSIVTVDSTGTSVIVPIEPPEDIVPDLPPVVDHSDECADSVSISDASVIKSGTAALFSFKMDAPKFCDSLLNPHVIVSGADGIVKDSAFAFSRKTREFMIYPLDPGEYTFKIKASSKKSKSVKQEFSADIEIRGRVWNMVAYGSWPKNVLKNAKPTIYSWNESNAIGDYWQYEALPKNAKAVETVGYWVRTESNVEFSLDLPLKKAESDSLSWTVEKSFSGWNMLANPYSWNLYVGSVDGFKSPEDETSPIWHWNNITARYDIIDTLLANEAFWIQVDRKSTISISSKPVFPAVKANSAAKKSSLLKSATKDSWSMMLVAATEDGVADSWNVLGVGSKNIAIAEPPAGMESAVGVSFVDEDNAMLAKRILAKASSEEYTWKVQLNASKSGKVNLALEGLDEVRAMGYEVSLVMDGKTYEWNDNSSMDVNVSGSKTAELKVVPAGKKIAAAKGIGNVHYDVVAGGIAVQFDVSAGMAGQKASVRLLDVNGNVVSTVYGNARSGTNDFRLAAPARSGVYVLQVRVGRESRVARLSL